MTPYTNNHNLKHLHKSLKIRQFHLNTIFSRKYKTGCPKLFCFWVFLGVSFVSRVFQGVSRVFQGCFICFWVFQGCFKGVSFVSVCFNMFQGLYRCLFFICSFFCLLVPEFRIVIFPRRSRIGMSFVSRLSVRNRMQVFRRLFRRGGLLCMGGFSFRLR